MELNIIKQIRTLRNLLKRKPRDIVAKKKLEELRPVIKRRELSKKIIITVCVDGEELTLSEIAKKYNLSIGTVKARYKAGNRGRLIARPSMRKPT